MRAKDFLKEDPGFHAAGPSGINFDPVQASNRGMVYTGARFNRYGADSPEPIPGYIHSKQIDQRISGGMTEKEAIIAQAKKAGFSVKEMYKMYNDYKEFGIN